MAKARVCKTLFQWFDSTRRLQLFPAFELSQHSAFGSQRSELSRQHAITKSEMVKNQKSHHESTTRLGHGLTRITQMTTFRPRSKSKTIVSRPLPFGRSRHREIKSGMGEEAVPLKRNGVNPVQRIAKASFFYSLSGSTHLSVLVHWGHRVAGLLRGCVCALFPLWLQSHLRRTGESVCVFCVGLWLIILCVSRRLCERQVFSSFPPFVLS